MLLDVSAIQKRFGGVTALQTCSLAVQAGEVHLLLGENGAGKSTLMKIVAGMQQRDGGDMRWKGSTVHFGSPKEAASMGIAMVHQESLLAPHLTVSENIFLGREERHPLGWVNRRKMMEAASRLIEAHKFPLQADWCVDRLSPAGKQLVEICRAIQHGSSLLIFDEPTSSLSDAETHEVFGIVKTLRDRGTGVIYITHRLEELRTVGDRVTVLRDGETVHTGLLADIHTDQLIRHMVGREMSAIYHRDPLPPGNEVLRLEGITAKPRLSDISLTVRAGEIVGLGGLIGAGRTELCRALFGIDPIESGTITIDRRVVHPRSPIDAVAAGIALSPQDRQKLGLGTGLPV